MHRRARPARHRLKYRIFMLLLDLDEMEGVTKRLRFLSSRTFNLFSFHERDHADGAGAPLRDWVEKQLAQGGIDLEGGAIRLLAIPRILGYGFNPISVWFCHDRDGQLKAYLHRGFWQPMDTLRDKNHLEALWASGAAPWLPKDRGR